MEYIDAIALKERMDRGEDFTIVDVREPYELDICRIDALHIPMAEIAERNKEIPRDTNVIIMCRSGKRAMAVANLLIEDFEMKNISILDGGILAWIEEVDNQLEVY